MTPVNKIPLRLTDLKNENHYHRVSFMELDHLLTRSCLTYPEVSSKFYHDSFCQSDSSDSLPWVIYFEAFYLHIVSSFSCIPVICPKFVLFLTPLPFVHLFCNLSQVYPAVILMYFISAAIILPSSSSSPHICHAVRSPVDPFRSHVSRSLFRGLPRFLLPVGE